MDAHTHQGIEGVDWIRVPTNSPWWLLRVISLEEASGFGIRPPVNRKGSPHRNCRPFLYLATPDRDLICTIALRVRPRQELQAWTRIYRPGIAGRSTIVSSQIWRMTIGPPLRSVCAFAGHLLVGDSLGNIYRVAVHPSRPQRDAVTPAHRGAVLHLATDHDRSVSTGEDGCVLLHERGMTRLLHRHDDFATCACFLGSSVISGGYDGRLRVMLLGH